LLKDKPLRVSIAKAARERVERKFSRDANTTAFIDLYQRLLEEKK
jgi:glycosyltransferase involved in cell wall biosynthesis